MTTELAKAGNMTLPAALENAVSVVERGYLQKLNTLEVIPPTHEDLDIDPAQCGQFYHLTHLVYNKEERFLDKLITVVNVVSALEGTLTTLIHSDGREVSYYLGILSKRHRTDSTQDRSFRRAAEEAFSGALEGNFAGSKLEKLELEQLRAFQEKVFEPERIQAISAVSGVVALRNKDQRELNSYVQGIENLTDSLRGKSYTILMLADPVDTGELQEIKHGYEMIYTHLSAFQRTVYSANESANVTMSTAETEGITQGITEGITKTQTSGKSKSKWIGANIGISVGIPCVLSGSLGISGGFSGGTNTSESVATSTTESKQTTRQTTSSSARSLGAGKSIQVTTENRTVKHLLEKIDRYIQRLELCESFGAFNCAAYVLSGSLEDTLSAASSYNALMRGENSSIQASQINIWQPAYEQKESFSQLSKYLRSFTHPRFYLDAGNQLWVTPASLLSGQEAAIQMGLPQKSIPGLSVNEMAAFGRSVELLRNRSVELGCFYHMGQEELTPLLLDVDSLTAHTFVTGSTGAGKSNIIYHLLCQLCLQKGSETTFLVIEPVKGEYKQVLGGYSDVFVYGTNPQKTPLLQLNPFSFPEDIHVLEHIDRLVEIFNACWPMYAAMPAVLKDAIERSYVLCGWDLARSVCIGHRCFPTFTMLLRELPKVLTESAYAADTKGDYTGALVTRIKSLTNGINGQIFCSGTELEEQELFERNVIVDISRVGSMETKALLMGILMIKLQEYRMAHAQGMNQSLRHITVLEEAHALLRRTSPEQSLESANLQGRSVELLSNAIAEMRTYGEGFIIADQAPGLLDSSVIRNTNTKILLRLPDEGDRLLVGQAAGLRGQQIQELAKLKVGVAAVYQNNWIEPVLCQTALFQDGHPFQYVPSETEPASCLIALFQRLLGEETKAFSQEEAEKLFRWVEQLDTGNAARQVLRQAISGGKPLPETERNHVLYCLVKGKTLIEQMNNAKDLDVGYAFAAEWIANTLHIPSDLAERIRQSALRYVAGLVGANGKPYRELLQYGGVI